MNRLLKAMLLTSALALGWLAHSHAVAEADATSSGNLFAPGGQVRCHFVWCEELVKWPDGNLAPVIRDRKKGVLKSDKKPKHTKPPIESWMSDDFDDRQWPLTVLPIKHEPYRRDLATLYLRHRFVVPDPTRIGEVKLALAYRGGAVVYLNGKEIRRGHMPEGKVTTETLAQEYPKEAYLDAQNTLVYRTRRGKVSDPERVRARTRRLEVRLPVKAGENLLAIEVHRAPTSLVMYKGKRPKARGGIRTDWSMLGLDGLRIRTAQPVAPTKSGGVRVWAGNPLTESWSTDVLDCTVPETSLEIPAARNGAYSAVVMVHSSQAIQSLTVKPTDFKHESGGAAIPAVSVQVRFAMPGDRPQPRPTKRAAKGACYLGQLAEALPGELPIRAGHSGVTVPVWLTIRVAKNAKPGAYTGHAKIQVNGTASKRVELRIQVADFTLPDPKDFVSYANLMQYPESVALKYKVEMWSEEHWKLLDKTFQLLGEVGVKAVFVPLIARSNMGNQYSMVRWIRNGAGWRHDFTVAERYLDLAIKHLGKRPTIVLYLWTPVHGGGGFGKIVEKPKNDYPMHFTVLDPSSGEMTLKTGPDWGSTESVPFWRPVFEGMRKILTQRGINDRAALGLLCDRVPSKQCLNDMAAVAAEYPWTLHAHGRMSKFAGKPLKLDACVWGIRGPFTSTDRYPRNRWGWKNSVVTTVFPRYGAGSMGHVGQDSPVPLFHALIEGYQASGYNGVGRVAADLWPVVKGKRGRMTTVLGRYKAWQRPGEPSLSVGSFLLPGPEGPVASVRFEALRLGIQETEARLFIEMALHDKAKRAKLGQELSKRAQRLLDGRVRAIRHGKLDYHAMFSRGTDASWLKYAHEAPVRATALFQVASEVAKALEK